jgi:hypothetical protein
MIGISWGRISVSRVQVSGGGGMRDARFKTQDSRLKTQDAGCRMKICRIWFAALKRRPMIGTIAFT